VRTRFLLVLTLAALATACAAGEPPPAAEAENENDLDGLDLANSWTTAANPANPDVAGPLWWASMMHLNGPTLGMRALLDGRPREPVGVLSKPGFAETGAFRLGPGKYAVLVQYKENDRLGEGTALGDVTLLDHAGGAVSKRQLLGRLIVASDHQVGAGGWRRAYLRFEVAEASPVRTIRVENALGKGEWQFGLVAIHREGRPFYAIAHNPDSIEALDKAMAEGANALEPDLRESKDKPALADAADESLAVTEELLGHAVTLNGQSKFGAYLRELNAKAAHKLIIWDTKVGASKDYAAVGASIRRVIDREHFDLSKSVFNVADPSMAPMWQAFADRPAVGRAYDGVFEQVHSHTAAEWMKPVRDLKLTFQGLGVTPQLQVTEKWSVPISVYVRAREQEEFPKKIYFWTVNEANAIRRMLDLGIDAMITDEIALLRSILREAPYDSIYTFAGDDDDPSAKHGGAWFHVASSSDLHD
jgi:hypothetical protein